MKEPMPHKATAKIAAILMIFHGLIEVSAPFTLSLMSSSLVSFGGLDRAEIKANIGAIVALGILWGLVRFVAAWGTWSLNKWGLALGISMSLITMIASVSVIPAGVADTILAAPALGLLLYAWFGSRKIEV